MGTESSPLFFPIGHAFKASNVRQLVAGANLIVPETKHSNIEFFEELTSVVGESGVNGRQFARHCFIYSLLVNQATAPNEISLFFFDKFELHAVGTFKEHHPAAAGD
jgi:hypothetical protein